MQLEVTREQPDLARSAVWTVSVGDGEGQDRWTIHFCVTEFELSRRRIRTNFQRQAVLDAIDGLRRHGEGADPDNQRRIREAVDFLCLLLEVS